jgi:hypothetical protein
MGNCISILQSHSYVLSEMDADEGAGGMCFTLFSRLVGEIAGIGFHMPSQSIGQCVASSVNAKRKAKRKGSW